VIGNRESLLSHGAVELRAAVLDVIEAGLAASDPGDAVERLVSVDGDDVVVDGVSYGLARGRVLVIGAGKATLSTAAALQRVLGDRIDGGLIVVPRGHAHPLGRIEVIEADHPLPTEASLAAARRLAALAGTVKRDDLVLSCFTGGSSALASLPADGVTIDEKHELHRLLVRSGAGIGEVNAVRKHVSSIKGGRLARAMGDARIVNLTVSDVAGGALDAITDPTVQDTTTVADAIEVLRLHDLWDQVAPSVRRHLESASAASPSLDGSDVRTVVLVDGETACRAMAARAEELGHRPIVLSTSLEGESREVGATLIDLGRESARNGRPFAAPCMLIGCGGETTVTIRNGALLGAGGPNQEAALGAALRLARGESVAAAFLDTDGSDGGSGAAGALVDAQSRARAVEAGIDLRDALVRHASGSALRKLGDLIVTGPTGTNVNDMFAIGVAEGGGGL
ncbi:MAG: glycerate kinase type-2 family protein, partial [Gaiellales bacterium]